MCMYIHTYIYIYIHAYTFHPEVRRFGSGVDSPQHAHKSLGHPLPNIIAIVIVMIIILIVLNIILITITLAQASSASRATRTPGPSRSPVAGTRNGYTRNETLFSYFRNPKLEIEMETDRLSKLTTKLMFFFPWGWGGTCGHGRFPRKEFRTQIVRCSMVYVGCSPLKSGFGLSEVAPNADEASNRGRNGIPSSSLVEV